jgi:microcompartment protein CcmK/EutM
MIATLVDFQRGMGRGQAQPFVFTIAIIEAAVQVQDRNGNMRDEFRGRHIPQALDESCGLIKPHAGAKDTVEREIIVGLGFRNTAQKHFHQRVIAETGREHFQRHQSEPGGQAAARSHVLSAVHQDGAVEQAMMWTIILLGVFLLEQLGQDVETNVAPQRDAHVDQPFRRRVQLTGREDFSNVLRARVQRQRYLHGRAVTGQVDEQISVLMMSVQIVSVGGERSATTRCAVGKDKCGTGAGALVVIRRGKIECRLGFEARAAQTLDTARIHVVDATTMIIIVIVAVVGTTVGVLLVVGDNEQWSSDKAGFAQHVGARSGRRLAGKDLVSAQQPWTQCAIAARASYNAHALLVRRNDLVVCADRS